MIDNKVWRKGVKKNMPPWRKLRFIGWKKINSQKRYWGKRSCSFNLFVFLCFVYNPNDTLRSWKKLFFRHQAVVGGVSICLLSSLIHIWATEVLGVCSLLEISHMPGRDIRNEEAEALRITPDYFVLIRSTDYGFHLRLWDEMSKLRENLHVEMECFTSDMGSHEVQDKGSTIKEKSARWIRWEVQKIEKESWKKQSVLRLFVRISVSERSWISTSGADGRVWPRVNFFFFF